MLAGKALHAVHAAGGSGGRLSFLWRMRTALPSGVCEICGVEVLENKKSYKQSTK